MNEKTLAAIEAAVVGVYPDIREDVRNQIVLECLQDDVSERGVKIRAARVIKQYRAQFYKGKFSELSIDQPISRDGEGATFAEFLPERNSRVQRDPGRPSTKRTLSANCQTCGSRFEWVSWRGTRPRKYCSRLCYGATVSIRRTKIKLSHRELRKLYWEEGLSLKDIAKRCGVRLTSIWFLMKEYGIERRPPGQNHPPAKQCVVSGCEAPIHKYLTKKDGSMWGNRCLAHKREYDRGKTNRWAQGKRKADREASYLEWKRQQVRTLP